jgi:AraC-like DNA-binding protein
MRVRAPPPPEGTGLYAIRPGGGGARTRLICGFIGCARLQGNPVLATLPAALKLKADAGAPEEWVRSTFHYAAEEVSAGRAGSDLVLVKLAELLFVQAVRAYVERLPAGQTGWLAGLGDPFVARALALIHTDPTRDWTLDGLGAACGLSRSALGERFARLIGMAPMQYLTNWRMQIAARELKDSHASLAQIAELTGYGSEAAFSRAFKKAFGASPATWRRSD